MGEYLRYTGGISLLDIMLSPLWGRLASLALMMALAWTVWRFRRADPRSQQFSCLLAAVLAATLIVVPMVAPYNQILLVPAMLLVVREWRALWITNALAKALCMATVLVVGWQWAGALALVVASFWLPPETVQKGWTLPLHTILVIPFVLLFQTAVLVGRAWTPAVNVPERAVASLQ